MNGEQMSNVTIGMWIKLYRDSDLIDVFKLELFL